MASTSHSSDAPVSRADARPRSALVLTALGLLLAFATASPGSAVAQREACLSCNPMSPTDECCDALRGALEAPCARFLDCQARNRTAVEACIQRDCRVPVRYAECDHALDCSRECTSKENCSIELSRTLREAGGGCSIGRGTARRACNRCFDPQPPVCRDLAADTYEGSRCQRRCIKKQPWIEECYDKCDDRCADDRCAVALCRRSCRDSICQTLRTTCSLDEEPPLGHHELQVSLRDDYQICCDKHGCEEDSSAGIACLITTSTSTSSTSSTSSTTVQTSTTSTVRGTSPTTTLP